MLTTRPYLERNRRKGVLQAYACSRTRISRPPATKATIDGYYAKARDCTVLYANRAPGLHIEERSLRAHVSIFHSPAGAVKILSCIISHKRGGGETNLKNIFWILQKQINLLVLMYFSFYPIITWLIKKIKNGQPLWEGESIYSKTGMTAIWFNIDPGCKFFSAKLSSRTA